MEFSVKRIVGVCLLSILSVGVARAQLSFGGEPIELPLVEQSLKSTQGVEPVDPSSLRLVPEFSVEDFRARYAWNPETAMGSAYVVGTALEVGKDFFELASVYMIGSRKVYVARIAAEEAQALSVTFDRLRLASGDKLYIYSPSRSTVLGAFTSETNPDGGIMGTAPIAGNEVCIQYEPAAAPKAEIRISHLGYLCNIPAGNRELALPPNNVGETMSDVCHVNINCPEGDQVRDVQNGITQIYTKLGKNLYAICSGTVVNNTKEDFRPLVITAAHCMINKGVEASADDLREWVFTFHYERPYCQDNEMVKKNLPTLSGARKLAITSNNGESDGLLLELLAPIPDSYGVYYNGWNREDVAADKAVGLHHPKGDAMKISTVEEKLVSSQFKVNSGDIVTGGENAHWLAIFAKTPNGHGVTQGGSSGSGLFNSENELIGTLSGGASQCSRVLGSNHYGKLSKHWNAYNKGTDDSHMDIHLDPLGKGTAKQWGGAYKPGTQYVGRVKGLQAQWKDKEVILSWKALASLPQAIKGNIVINRDDKEIARLSLTESSYVDKAPVSEGGIAVYSVSYRYAIGNEAEVTSLPTSLAVFLAEPAPVKSLTIKKENGKSLITWKKPVNRECISQVSLKNEAEAQVIQNFSYFGLTLPKTVYFGVRYDGSDFIQLPQARIVGARFIPSRGSTMHDYNLYIRNGAKYDIDRLDSYVKVEDTDEEVRDYPLKSLKYQEGKWLMVKGFSPFKVRPEHFVVVGVKATTATEWNKKALMVDATPRSKKSADKSVFSFDSEKWMPLSEPLTEAEGKAFVMDVYIDDAELNEPVDIEGTIAYGTMPAPFPVVKEYKIYMDNQYLTSVSAQSEHSYEISNAPEDAKFYIHAIYEDGRIVTANEAIGSWTEPTPELFPTVVREQLSLRGVGNSAQVRVFNASGEKIHSQELSDSFDMDCSQWASGLYLIEIITPHGPYLFKVTKL